ncbi:MAG: hypothetical protein EOO11_16355 [Chitinophagaceae bacterium]|nr:MAG: hypothetical protein EOO11_16355 [Chitinophagaceae bacterium]
MRLLFALLLFFHVPSDTVLVCFGSRAYAYHDNAGCSGLQRCRGSVERMEASKAVAMGRTPCHICRPAAVAPARSVRSDDGPAPATAGGRCGATTKKGTQCSRSARSGGYCWQHGG